MKIDRAVQRQFLETMRDAYPSSVDVLTDVFSDVPEAEEEHFIGNLLYLEEHGLCESGVIKGADGHFAYGLAVITAKGLDFLADDGGLGAVLGVVTIKLHDDQLLSMIEMALRNAPETTPDKQKLLSQLRELPGEAIKHLTLKLVDAGLRNWPAALLAIQTSMGR